MDHETHKIINNKISGTVYYGYRLKGHQDKDNWHKKEPKTRLERKNRRVVKTLTHDLEHLIFTSYKIGGYNIIRIGPKEVFPLGLWN